MDRYMMVAMSVAFVTFYTIMDAAYISTGKFGDLALQLRPILMLVVRRSAYLVWCFSVNRFSDAIPPDDERSRERNIVYKKSCFWMIHGMQAIALAAGLSYCQNWMEVRIRIIVGIIDAFIIH